MSARLDLDERDVGVAGGAGGGHVLPGALHADRGVVARVDHQCGHAEREPAQGVGLREALGHLGWRPAEQRVDDPPRAGKVGDGCERGNAAKAHSRHGAHRRGRQPAPTGGPQRELPAGRVADGRDAVEVEPRVVEQREVVDRGGDVVEGLRPATALAAAQPAVLDVPGRPAVAREVRGDRAGRELAVDRLPVPPVQHDRDGVRAVTTRDVEVGDLHRVGVGVGVARWAAERCQRDAEGQ